MTGSSQACNEPPPLLGTLIGDAARKRLLPDRPARVSAVAEPAGILVSWGEPSSPLPLLGYRIYRRDERESPQLLTSREQDAHAYLDQNVTPGAAYYYSVTAVSSSGEGARSPERRATAGE